MARRPLNITIRDGQGVLIPSATVTVTVHATGGVATIYAAESGGVALAGGVATTDGYGSCTAWVDDGDYGLFTLFNVAATKMGYSILPKTINA